MKSMNSLILVILISAGGVSLAMAVPVNEVPALWSLILSLLRPPYLHIVINGIIITIAAASRFCRNQPAPPVRPQNLISYKTPPPAYYAAYSSLRAVVEAAAEAVYESDDRVVELKAVMVNGREVAAEDEGEIEFADRTLTYDTPSPERFTPAANPTGNVAERVRERPPTTTEEEYESLESAWKKITEGASRAAAAEEEARCVGASRPSPDVLKSSSFKERRAIYKDSPPSRASFGIRKEETPSQDELNRRVEAIIKKVNDEIILRRQKSSNQYIQLSSAA